VCNQKSIVRAPWGAAFSRFLFLITHFKFTSLWIDLKWRWSQVSLSLSPTTTAFKSYTKFSVSSLHLFLTSCYSVGLAPYRRYRHRQHTYSHHFIYLCDAHAFKKCTNYLFCTIHTHTASIHPPVSFKPSSRYRTCNWNQEVPSSADLDTFNERSHTVCLFSFLFWVYTFLVIIMARKTRKTRKRVVSAVLKFILKWHDTDLIICRGALHCWAWS